MSKWILMRRFLLAVVLVVLCAGARAPDVRREIRFPDLPGYRTLKCDFHMHTVFSDGNVWPTVRVDEAWREGLDAIALTDHAESQSHKQDLNINRNRPFEIALPRAKEKNILLIKGAEITRSTPPGHHNAIFLSDAEPLNTPDLDEAVRQAILQKAFVFWNHPGPQSGQWGRAQARLLERKQLQGVEICNGQTYHPDAHRWAIEKGLVVVGNTDQHDPQPADRTPEVHRTTTLVFAVDKNLEALKEALLAGRTAVWCGNQLIGPQEYLRPLFDACVEVRPPHYRAGDMESRPPQRRARGNVCAELVNRCELDIELERIGTAGPEKVTLPACSTLLLKLQSSDRAGSVDLAYRAVNFLVAPDRSLEVKLTVAIPPAAPATSTAPAAPASSPAPQSR